MKTEPVAAAADTRPEGDPNDVTPRGARGNPPDWLIVGLGGAYVLALAGLIFLPGGTLIGRLHVLDGGICAQLPGHSFILAGQLLPLCARNTGIYVGFSCALLTLQATGRLRTMRLPTLGVAFALGLCVLALAVDGFNSLFLDLQLPHLYQPHNLLRLATGLATGTAMAAFLAPIANGLIWQREDLRPSFAGFRQLAVMVPVLLLAFLGIASQSAWLLYPLALLETAGLVMALSLINLVFLLALSGRTGRIVTFRQLLPLFSLTVALAVVELLALSALKTSILQSLGGVRLT
jgi:uncharacterized membrane protein